MNPRDWFLVGVRLFGVWPVLQGISMLVIFALTKLQFFAPVKTNPASYLLESGVDFIVGFYFISGAPLIANIAYPRKSQDDEDGRKANDERQ